MAESEQGLERTEVTDRVEALLRESGVPFRIYPHAPVFTSEEAARVRGTPIEQGAKALVIKAGDQYYLVLISAVLRADNRALRRILGVRGVRFVSEEELLRLTGCRPGAVPPLGNLFGLPVLMDESLRRCEQVSFNAGSNSWSVTMRRKDLERVVAPRICAFAVVPEEDVGAPSSAGLEHQVSIPPIPLNHCFRVLDSATYRAIEESAFLRTEFAVFETRTTVRSDRIYTGLYLYGAHTYFEFFDVARETMGGLGHSGLAFGVDEPGGLQQLQERLAPEFPVANTTITRQLGGRQLPWFLYMAPTGLPSGSAVSLWYMEYLPSFLAEWHPQPGGPEEGIRRDQILQRYAATLKADPSQTLLRDVIGLMLAVDPSTQQFLARLCGRMGYHSRTEGEVTRLDGPDIELGLIPETASARGIQEMMFRVRRAPAGATSFRFGPKSVLSFRDDSTAVWSF